MSISQNIDLSNLNDSYYYRLLYNLLGHMLQNKKIKDVDRLLEILKDEIEKTIKEDFRASILVTSVSKEEGRNFYLPGESLLSEDEVKEIIDDLDGIYIYNNKRIFLFKIKNSRVFENYKKEIIATMKKIYNEKKNQIDEGIDFKRLLEKVNAQKIKKLYLSSSDRNNKKSSGKAYSNIALFLILNDFILYILKYINKYSNVKSDDELLIQLLNRDENILYVPAVFTVLGSEKKRKYYINNLVDFIFKFYPEEKTKVSEYSIIGSFLFSFYIIDKDFRDKVLGLLDKFLYYLIFKEYINWAILSQMISIFYDYNSKKFIRNNKKPISIKGIKFFIMMDLKKYFHWAYETGKTIIKESPTNGKDYIEEIIKNIRKEELPGRFKDELYNSLYKITEKIKKEKGNPNFNLEIDKDIIEKNHYGDEFYKLKSAIMAGFINSLSYKSEEANTNNNIS